MKIRAPRHPVFISIRTRLLLSGSIIITLALTALFIWYYNYTSHQIWLYIQENARVTLQGALEGIDGDEFESLVRDMQNRREEWGLDGSTYPADERFWKHVNWLLTVHTIENRSYLYTYIPGSTTGEVAFIGSHGAPMNPSEGARPFETYTAPVLWDGLSGYSQTEDILETEDTYGTWALTLCAPIKNSRGEVVGALGIDYLSDAVEVTRARIRWALTIAFLVTLGLTNIVFYIIGSSLARPIQRLTEIAHRVGKGEYTQDLSGLISNRSQDEISVLAIVFDEMLDQLYEREKQRHATKQLTVDYDRDEVKITLDALTQTEEFARIQQKATALRARFTPSPEEEA